MRSPRRLLYAKENRFRLVNRCLFDRYFITGINLVARRCTASNLLMCFLRCGDQITPPYSKIGLTNVQYRIKKHIITHVAKAFSY